MPDTDYKEINDYIIETIRKDREAHASARPARIAPTDTPGGDYKEINDYIIEQINRDRQEHARANNMTTPELSDQPSTEEIAAENLKNKGEFRRGVTRGVDITQATLYGFTGLAGSAVGSDKLKKFGFEGYKRNMEEAAENPVSVTFDELSVTEPLKIGKWVIGTLGELAPSMAEAALTATAGAIIGSATAPGPGTAVGAVSGFFGRSAARKLIKEGAEAYIKKGIAKEAAEAMAKKEVAKVAQYELVKSGMRTFGAKAGLIAGVMPLEAGGNWAEVLEETGVDNPTTALATGMAAAFLELVGGNMRLIQKMLPGPKAAMFSKALSAGDSRLIARLAKEALISGSGEYMQEAGQEFLSLLNVAANDPEFKLFAKENLQRLNQAGWSGFVGGSFGGLVGTAKTSKSPSRDAQKMREAIEQTDINTLPNEIKEKLITEAQEYNKILDSNVMDAAIAKLQGEQAATDAAPTQQKETSPAATPTEMPLGTSVEAGKNAATEERRAADIKERTTKQATKETKDLFDAITEENLAENQALEEARQAEVARLEEENRRRAEAEAAQTQQAVATAQGQQAALKTELAGEDVRKQKIVDDVLELTEKKLLTALQKDASMSVAPAGRGIYTLETANGPIDMNLFALRRALSAARIAAFNKKLDKEQQDAEALAQSEARRAAKKAQKDAEDSLKFSRQLLNTGQTLTPENIAFLTSNIDKLSEAEKAKLAKAQTPAAPISQEQKAAPRQSDILEEQENPDYQAAAATAGLDTDALVKSMLLDLEHSSKAGLVYDPNINAMKRIGAGVSWLTAANKAGVKVDRANARTILEKVQQNDTLTPQQQKTFDALIDAANKSGGNALAAAITWAEKGYERVSDKKINVDDLVEGDSFVIADEAFNVTDIDEAGNVTLKDGAIRKVRQGAIIEGVEYVKYNKDAASFDPAAMDDQPAAKEKKVLNKYIPFKDLDASISISAITDEDSADYQHGHRFEAAISYPDSLGERGLYRTGYVYQNYPTEKEMKDDILHALKTELEDKNISDDVKAAIQKVLPKKEAPKPKDKKEDPYLAAVGKITGGVAARAKERGFEFVYGDTEKGSDIYNTMVGMFSGGAAEKLISAGITIKKTETKASIQAAVQATLGIPAKPDRKVIGQNAAGQDIFEDKNGVRSIVLNGVRRSEPVQIIPTRAGVQGSVDIANRADEYKTTEELPAPQAETPAAFGQNNTIFTEDKAAKAREILLNKLKKHDPNQLNAGLDPEMMTAGIDLAGYYIEGGIRDFASFSKKMIEDIGEAIRPFLKSFYMAIRNWPGTNNAGMNTEAEINAILAAEKDLTPAPEKDILTPEQEAQYARYTKLIEDEIAALESEGIDTKAIRESISRLQEDFRRDAGRLQSGLTQDQQIIFLSDFYTVLARALNITFKGIQNGEPLFAGTPETAHTAILKSPDESTIAAKKRADQRYADEPAPDLNASEKKMLEISRAHKLGTYGLKVTKGKTNKGTPVWNVSGPETRAWKETIKQTGGRWYGPKKVWSFYNTDPTEALLEALPPADQLHPGIKTIETPAAEKAKADADASMGIIHTGGMKPYARVADRVAEKLTDQTSFTREELFEMANQAFGGTLGEGKYTAKDAYDAMEMGINKYLLDQLVIDPTMDAKYAHGVVKNLKDMLELIPAQTTRTAEMDEYQQFSTVPPLAYVANWAANLQENDVYLEPSAGTGNLAVFAQLAGVSEIITNELAPRRAKILKVFGFDQVFTENAEQLNNILPAEIKPTVVVMNPPFSSTAGRIAGQRKTINATVHIEQALKRLEPGGRLVAIAGKGMAADKPAFSAWWKNIEQEYNVRANIGVSGKEYVKYGTNFDNQIIVIDKPLAKSPKKSILKVTGNVDTVEELINLLEGVRNDRIISTNQQTQTQSGVPQGAGTTQTIARPGESLLPPTDESRPDTDQGSGRTPAKHDQRGNARLETGKRDDIPNRDTRPAAGTGELATSPNAARPGAGTNLNSQRSPDFDAAGLSGTPDVQSLTIEQQTAIAKSNAELSDSVYDRYTPAKLAIPGALPHPGNLVESAAMATVEPVDPTYAPHLPEKVIKSGKLSIAQLEAVVYAGQAHNSLLPDGSRRGFFIGDGTGVGKGREIAAILWDNWNQGRKKAIWLSQNSPLLQDAKRDVRDIGWNEGLLFDLGKAKLQDKISTPEGICFAGYGTLRSKRIVNNEQVSRLDQIVNWLGKDFDGVIIFDEAHNMGNALSVAGVRGRTKASETALAGLDLQKSLPNARVVYVSATGATEVMNLAYAQRLGLWGDKTPFPTATHFVNSISAGGITAMELVAMNIKADGGYMARSLAYDDIKVDRITHPLTPEQRIIYDELAEAWQIVQRHIEEAMKITHVVDEGGTTLNAEAKGALRSALWGTNQRFWNQIITSMQMPTLITQLETDIKNGHAPILQLVNTNEAAQERAIARLEEDDTLEDLDITPREMLMEYVKNSFPVHQYEEYTDEEGNKRSRLVLDSNGNPVINRQAVELRDELLTRLGSIRVPDGPLEMLLDHFDAENVAEVTGRTRRVIYKNTKEGRQRVIEPWSKTKSMADADAFMNDRKKMLIFSQAGGTGRSYHADNTAKNKRLRRHYVVQAGWRADTAVQGLGRSHRTNQAQAPEWILISTDLEGQKRFISTIARRLSQLGALTKGSRESGNQGLFNARDNLESKEARDAWIQLLHDIYYGDVPGITMTEFMHETGMDNLIDKNTAQLNKQLPPVTRFLNRILNLKIDRQNQLFNELSARINIKVAQAIEEGSLDVGVETIRAKRTRKINEQIVYQDERTKAKATYLEVELTHDAKLMDYPTSKSFAKYGYVRNRRSGHVWALATQKTRTDATNGSLRDIYVSAGPGYNYQDIETKDVSDPAKYEKLNDAQAEAAWINDYKSRPAEVTENVHMVTGSILPIWDRLPEHKARIYRLNVDGKNIIGRVIPAKDLTSTLKNLGAARRAAEFKPADVLDKIINHGYSYMLANGWKLRRRKVAGEYRAELDGANYYNNMRELEKYGVFTERIQYQTRMFIPTDTETGAAAIAEIISTRPIVEESGSQKKAGDVTLEDAHLLNDLDNFYEDEPQLSVETEAIPTEKLPPEVREEALKTIAEDFELNNEGDIAWQKETLSLAEAEELLESDGSITHETAQAEGYDIDALVADIKERGIVTPVVIGPSGIEGYHRLLAAKEAGLNEIPAYRYVLKAQDPQLSVEEKYFLPENEISEMVRELPKLIKGIEIIEANGQQMIKTKDGNAVAVEAVEEINPATVSLSIKKHYAQKELPAGARIAGMYQPGETKKITLVKGTAGIWTLSHEFYHFLEDTGAISNADKIILNNKIEALIKKDIKTYGYLQNRSLPERRAEWIGRTLTGMYEATTPTGKILAKIRALIDQIINALGIRTAQGVIRDIASGKVYQDNLELDSPVNMALSSDEKAVIQSYFSGKEPAASRGTLPILTLTGGPAAGGKTTTIPQSEYDIAVTANSDLIGEQLSPTRIKTPEVHETSSTLAKEVLQRAIAGGYDIIYNSQLTNYQLADEAITAVLKAGGQVKLFFTNIDAETSIARARAREAAYEEGLDGSSPRYVPTEVSIKGYNYGLPTLLALYKKYKGNPAVDIILMDNNVDFRKPVMVFSHIDGQESIANQDLFDKLTTIDYIETEDAGGIKYAREEQITETDINETAVETRRSNLLTHKRNTRGQTRSLPSAPSQEVTGEEEPLLSIAEDILAKGLAAAESKVSHAVETVTGQASPETKATLSKLKQQWQEFWKPLSTVKDGDKVLAARYRAMGNAAKAMRFIEAINQELGQLPPDIKKDMFWYLNGDLPLSAMPTEFHKLAENIKKRTEIIGEMLVDRGILTEKTFEKHKGQYVHYLYAKHIVGEDGTIGLTSSGKLNLTYTLARNPNLTTQQRRELGLIEDASVAVPVGMGKALTDIAKFDYLETIADNPDWVWQPSIVRVAIGKKLKEPIMGRPRRYIMMGVGKLVEQVNVYNEMMRTNPTPEVAEIHKALTAALDQAQKKTGNAPENFVQLPNARSYGPLAGAYVAKPIADDLKPVLDIAADHGKLFQTAVEIERQGMAWFKIGKVALNLPTAARNIVSNIIQQNMRGRALPNVIKDIISGCESYAAKDKYYEEAFGMGLFNTNWFVTEINEIIAEFRKAETGRLDQIINAVRNLAKYYGRIDDLSKLAIFKQMRQTGASIDEAALEAMKWGMDYSLTSRSIKGLRQTVMPFATYQYKIAPLIFESLKKRPWVLAKFALIYPAAKMLTMLLNDLDDDDWEELLQQLPAYIKKSGSMMILPWKSEKGQWQWVNLEYFFPYGNYLALFRDARDLDPGELIRDTGIGNPFLSMFYTGLSSREDQPPTHAFYGTPIYNALDPAPLKAAKYLEYMANIWTPAMLTRQGAAGYTVKAITGSEDRWGRTVTLPQAIGRWFGVNILSVSPERTRAAVSVKMQDIRKEMARIEADPSYSEAQKQAYQSRLNQRFADFAQEAPAAVLPITKAKGHDPVYEALKEMAASGILRSSPPARHVEIHGITMKMNMEQYRDYLEQSSTIARRKLTALVSSPGWAEMPAYRKSTVVEHIIANARKGVRQKIKAQILRENREKILAERKQKYAQ